MSEGVGVVLVMEAPVAEDPRLDTTSPDSELHEKKALAAGVTAELFGLGSDSLTKDREFGSDSPTKDREFGSDSLTKDREFGSDSPTKDQEFGSDSLTKDQEFGSDSPTKNQEFGKVSSGTVEAKHGETKEDSDSDMSSDENVREGNFSLNDSGVVVSSLPTSSDDIDNNNDIDSQIELISYSRNAGLDTAVISKATAKEHDLTVDGDLDQVEGVTEFRASSTASSFPPPNRRPQSLCVAESQSSSPPQAESLPFSQDDEHSVHSAVTLPSSEIAAMTPRSREIFEKARHFAEMVQKPSLTVKREKAASSELVEGDFSQEQLQDLELQRRAAISQSTVRRKDLSSPASPTHSASMEAKLSTPPSPSASPPESLVLPASPAPIASDQSGAAPVLTAVMGSSGDAIHEVCDPAQVHQTVDSHFEVPSPERSASPQARWTDNAGRYTLYSQNVVREDDSSEVVDRESIANLATTRQQWETIFSVDPQQEQPKTKRNPPKWQVRMPYTEKAAPTTQAAVTSNNSSGRSSPTPDKPLAPPRASDMESNIEREIRLAMEREEMLKREQEGRLQGGGGHRKQYKVSSMESSTESELLQPTFHELTEADRGSEFLLNEQRMQQANSLQEESLQKAFHHQKLHPPHRNDDDGLTESIIDQEIRLQREREAELTRQREEVSVPRKVEVLSSALPQTAHAPPPPPPPLQAKTEAEEDISYEEAVSQSSHQGESRIAQELRELKEREEEIRQLRERMSKASLGAGESQVQSKRQVAPSRAVSESSPVPAARTSHGPDKTVVSHPVSHSVHASHSLDPSPGPNDTSSVTQPRHETPMQREIRLARERENEFRRSRGLPELPTAEPEAQTNGTLAKTADAVDGVSYGGRGNLRHPAPQPDSGVRHFASNRLQREILEQKQREEKLQQEGHIMTTSEEHIQPMRYAEVVGQETADSPVRRNFKAPVRREEAPEGDAGETSPSPVHKQGAQPPARDSPLVKKTPGASASFKYKEFAQTAESRIERELREMREREEELRKQREGGSVDS